MKRLDAAWTMPQRWPVQGFRKKKLREHRTRGGRPVLSQIVEANKGDQDEDDTGKLSELITLVGVGLQAEEDEDDTGRLSELLALAEAGL
jgi:hypothetical protein